MVVDFFPPGDQQRRLQPFGSHQRAVEVVVGLGEQQVAALFDRQPEPARWFDDETVQAVGMTVSNLERSVAFFRDVLAFELVDQFEDSGRDTEP